MVAMRPGPRLPVRFFRSPMGREPVREWLKSLPKAEKEAIGRDTKKVQFGWPVGMPLVRALSRGLWELRTGYGRRVARVLFTVHEG